MTRAGFYTEYPCGLTTFTQTSEGNTHSNSHMIKADEIRQKEREEAARYFIPSNQFVGPERALNRAMRLLKTQKLADMAADIAMELAKGDME